MKASDLMINDYVLFDGKIAEVIAIKLHPREDLVTIKYDYDGIAFHCPTVEISRIQPIPLTESRFNGVI